MAELFVRTHDRPSVRWRLTSQALRIGRAANNDVTLVDEDGPPLWCTIERGRTGYRVVDHSGRGVELDGRRVVDHLLKDGSVIELGGLELVFRDAAQEHDGDVSEMRTGVLRTDANGVLRRQDLRLRMADGREVSIPSAGLRIGAHDDNDIVLDDTFVSSFHAELFWRASRLVLRDLGSTNGTRVDDVRVVEAELKAGNELLIGQSPVSVCADEVTESLIVDKDSGPWQLGSLVTADAAFAEVFELVRRVAPHDAPVCVFGETGCGKEGIAAAIHDLSARRRGPYIPVNCAAIADSLIESELFGHEKGAFTGADRTRKGVFEEAHTGTLFLDEIGELALDVQAKLLRVLETRAVRRLGGQREIPVDVRIVVATHRDLPAMVDEGKFREDLLHRVWVIPVDIPPLRARRDDVAFLAKHFAKTLTTTDEAVELTTAALDKLRSHVFSGNVRELKNTILRAVVMRRGKRIEADDIRFVRAKLEDVTQSEALYQKGMTLEDIERKIFGEVLRVHGNAAEAARALGVAKSTFWRKATSLGLMKTTSKRPELTDE